MLYLVVNMQNRVLGLVDLAYDHRKHGPYYRLPIDYRNNAIPFTSMESLNAVKVMNMSYRCLNFHVIEVPTHGPAIIQTDEDDYFEDVFGVARQLPLSPYDHFSI